MPRPYLDPNAYLLRTEIRKSYSKRETQKIVGSVGCQKREVKKAWELAFASLALELELRQLERVDSRPPAEPVDWV